MTPVTPSPGSRGSRGPRFSVLSHYICARVEDGPTTNAQSYTDSLIFLDMAFVLLALLVIVDAHE